MLRTSREVDSRQKKKEKLWRDDLFAATGIRDWQIGPSRLQSLTVSSGSRERFDLWIVDGSRIGRYGDATDRFGKDKLRTATERGERHFQLSTTNLSWDSIEDEDSGTDTAPARCWHHQLTYLARLTFRAIRRDKWNSDNNGELWRIFCHQHVSDIQSVGWGCMHQQSLGSCHDVCRWDENSCANSSNLPIGILRWMTSVE